MEGRETLRNAWQARQDVLTGNKEAIARQHGSGKNTARERVGLLLDKGSFVETDALKTGGNTVCGYGTVSDRLVYVVAQDYTSRGGAMGVQQAEKILKVLKLAQTTGAPVVFMLDSAGALLAEGADALNAYASVYAQMVRLSGVCPMISVIMGPCLSSAALLPQLSDIAVLTAKNGALALNTARVLGKELDAQALMAQGAVQLCAENEEQAIGQVVSILSLLPGSNLEDAPETDGEDLNRLLNDVSTEDGLALAAEIADGGAVVELTKDYGKAVHTLLCRVGGRTSGIIATDHTVDDGRLDAAACEKAARFVRLCDSYHIQLISLINSDGLAVGKPSEQAWNMHAAAQLTYAMAEATSPKVSLITGSAVGGAYIALGGKGAADVSYAWPEAYFSPLTAAAAVATLCDEQLTAGESREQLEKSYKASTDALYAAQSGLVDDIIEVSQTRKQLIAALEALQSKREIAVLKKHGNMPL